MGLPFLCKNTICSLCKIPHMKDPNCSGDYTVEGKLLSFCPDCGYMLPLLDVVDPPEKKTLSKTQRKKIGVRLAKKYQLDYKEMFHLVQGITGDDFEESLRFRISLVFDVDLEKNEVKSSF